MFLRGFRFLLPILTWILISGYYLYYTLNSAFQRDGAHFLFMANQICHGFSPYWASFETKTPLVEYFWCGGHLIVGNIFDLTIWQSARVFEVIYVFLTASVSYFFIKDTKKFDMPAMLLSSFILIFLLDPRITDSGFNISIYQPLFSLICIMLCISIVSSVQLKLWNILFFGVFLFLSWFIKQTSLLDLLLPCGYLVWIWKTKLLNKIRALVAISMLLFIGVISFFAYLGGTDTLKYYSQGAFGFHLKRVSTGVRYLNENTLRLFGSFKLPQDYPIYFVILLGVAAVFFIFLHRRRIAHQEKLLVFILWGFGCAISAVIPLTFFKHYWLVVSVPLAISYYYLSKELRPAVACYLSAAVGFCCLWLIYSSQPYLDNNKNDISPQRTLAALLERHISMEESIFLWGGLPHFYVFSAKISQIPQNMWWPFINGTREDNLQKLAQYLILYKPKSIIQIYEEYPPYESLFPFRITENLLKELSGCEYLLTAEERPSLVGRYSFPAQVFVRSSCSKAL